MVDWGLGHFGKTEPSARTGYLHFTGKKESDDVLEQLRKGGGSEAGRILGSEDFIREVLKNNNETVQKDITIDQLVDLVAERYKVLSGEMTSASRARNISEARAVTTLIGIDHCGYLLSDIARYFNRDMPTMSKQVKKLRSKINKRGQAFLIKEKE